MLQKLEIHALRGATEKIVISFEKGKTITILYGENGSGKSTICDAFELLALGKISSLDGKGLGKTESYWHSTGKKASDLRVTLTTTKGQWKAKLAKSKVMVTPEVGRPQVAVLRRSQILGLIAQQPKNRFDAVRPFLDIESVEQSEASLRKLIEEERSNRNTAVARIEENRVAVENFWKEAGSPGPSALDWARLELGKDTAQFQVELVHLEQLIKELERLQSEQDRLKKSEEDLAKAEETFQSSSEKVSQEQTKMPNEMADLVDLFKAAKAYLHQHDKSEMCPLCGSSEFITGLSHRVDEQLEAIQSLIQALELQGQAKKKLESAKERISNQTHAFLKATESLTKFIKSEELPSGFNYPQDLFELLDQFSSNAIDAKDLLIANEIKLKAAAFLDTVILARDKRKEKQGFLQTLKRSVETYDNNYAAQKELESLIPRLEQALTEIEAERRQFVDEILKKIATRVGEFYEAVHPTEGLSQISLLLDPGRRASLDIQSPFPGAGDIPPGAYFSESHLDTLGLCIWLALAELKDSQNTILVLDDVVASVDEPHVERVIELLYEVAQKFQHCIYTTHYRPWREKYRWGWLRNGQCHFVELLSWSHGTGIKHGKSLPPVEELQDLLSKEQPSAQLVCASAGVILEAILDFLTKQYHCRVPRRSGDQYTLGDLLPAINKKLRAALRIERLSGSDENENPIYEARLLGPDLDELQRIAQSRNIFGCHFNTLSFSLLDSEAIPFGQKVLDLAMWIIDVEHGWPGKKKSGYYWSTSDESRRLYPLEEPS